MSEYGMEFCHLKQNMKMVQSFLLQSPSIHLRLFGGFC